MCNNFTLNGVQVFFIDLQRGFDLRHSSIFFAACALLSAPLLAIELPPGPVAITKGVMNVPIRDASDKVVIITRIQDNDAVVNSEYAKTSRPCPPACIQPNSLGQGIETIAELEMIGYIRNSGGAKSNIVIVDSRISENFVNGYIPGAINIPWTTLDQGQGAKTEDVLDIMTKVMGVKLKKDADAFVVDEAIAAGGGKVKSFFDFSGAKTLVFYCNGSYCGQSPKNIEQLTRFGYPAEKIKWYRGGMDDWEGLGLTVSKP